MTMMQAELMKMIRCGVYRQPELLLSAKALPPERELCAADCGDVAGRIIRLRHSGDQ
jgi:hypothetical protein